MSGLPHLAADAATDHTLVLRKPFKVEELLAGVAGLLSAAETLPRT